MCKTWKLALDLCMRCDSHFAIIIFDKLFGCTPSLILFVESYIYEIQIKVILYHNCLEALDIINSVIFKHYKGRVYGSVKCLHFV